MENGSSSGSGFVRSDKVAVAAETVEAGGGLGLKLQRTESFPFRMMIRHHQHRPFSFSQSQTGGGGGGGGGSGSGRAGGDGGPTSLNGGNEEVRSTTMCSIYDCAGAGSALRTLQPFNATTTAFVSSGDMAASLGFPFTQAQWNELQRQAMIYKYMMASAPVPPDLLISATRNFSDTAASYSNLGRGSFYNLRFSNNTDPEPGRCRRTDGKKWRCSRDVAPDQKYCERHMHRGRPRSRKPVEVHTQINTINSDTNKTPASATPATAILPDLTVSSNAASSQHLGSADPFQQPLFYQPSHHKASPFEADISASSYKEPRYLEWMMKGETSPMASSNQQWQQLMPSKFGLRHDGTSYNGNAPSLQQHYEKPLSLHSYREFGSQGPKNQQHNDEGCFFVSTEDPRNSDREQTPRRFLDAWSTIVKDDSTSTGSKSSVTSSAKLSLSSLALSMSGGRGSIQEDMDHIQMGLGINDSDPNRGGGGKSLALSWMNSSPVSWMASPPGGPLAEALGTGTTGAAGQTSCAVGLNLMSDSCGGSPQATTMSSPSGVITRTLASLSDSSGSSSPTFAAAAVSGKPDTVLQWLSRTKLESS